MSNTVKVRKRNKVLNIPEGRLASYLNQGYDCISDDGKIIEKATGGGTVSIAEYNKLQSELEELKKSGNEALMQENENLKEENNTLIKRIDEVKHFMTLTAEELKSELESRGIEHGENDNKNKLLTALIDSFGSLNDE